MDEKALEFWMQHSVNFLEMALKNDKREKILHPDGYGKYIRECGDSVEIFLTARDGNIQSASFHTDGCIYTVACANAVIRMIEGKSTETAWTLLPRDIVEFLETLPKKETHCAELAIQALRAALIDLRATEQRPWTKFYRT